MVVQRKKRREHKLRKKQEKWAGTNRGSITARIYLDTMTAAIIANFAHAIGTIVDGIISGSFLGVNAVAAMRLTSPALIVYSLIGSCVSSGCRNRCAHKLGEGDVEGANRMLALAVWFTMGIDILMALLSVIFRGPLAVILGASGQNAHLAPLVMDYLLGFCICMPLANLNRTLVSLLQMDGDNRRSIWSASATTVADIIGDLLAVLVFSGGMFGLGLATSIGNLICTLVVLPHFFNKKYTLHLGFRMADFGDLLEMLRRGTMSGVKRFSSLVRDFAINRILTAYVSSTVLAAYALQGQMSSLASAFMIGAADTVCVLAGIFYGEEDKKALADLQQVALRIGGLVNLVLSVVMFTAAVPITTLYLGRKNPEAIPYGVVSVRCYAISILLQIFYYLALNYLNGIAQIAKANTMMVLRDVIILIPVTWCMVMVMGGRGALIAPVVCLLIVLVFSLIYIMRRPEKTVRERLLMLPAGFGVGAEKDFDMSVDSEEDVQMLSRIAMVFCVENGVSEDRGKELSLAIEEMAGNIVKYGFSDGKKHNLQIRMLIKEEDVILRIRDDCRPFNPKEQYELMRKEHEDFSGIGIRIVMGMVKDFQYISTFNTNNLIIRI